MPAGATRHDDDALGVEQLTTVVDECRESDVVGFYVHPASHAVGEAFGLLEYLLEHEVRIATLLYLTQIDVYGLYLELLFLIEYAHHLQFLAQSQHGYVAVVKIYHLVGILDDGTCVGAKEELAVAYSHHQRTLLARRYDLVGGRLVQYGDGIGTYHLMECHLDGSQQVEVLLVLDIFHQLYEHLRIGVRTECHAFVDKILLYVGIILYYAVMDDGKILGFGIVRMGVHRRRFAMRCPACVGNTYAARDVLVSAECLQIGHLALGFVDIQVAAGVLQCNTGTVIATVLQTFQSFDKYGISLLLTQISHYSTHNLLP